MRRRRRTVSARLRPTCPLARQRLACGRVDHKAQRDLLARKTRPLITRRRYRCAVLAWWLWFTVVIWRIALSDRAAAPVYRKRAITSVGHEHEDNEQKKRHPFSQRRCKRDRHGCQSLIFSQTLLHDVELRGNSLSRQDYGLRTYEPARAGMQQRYRSSLPVVPVGLFWPSPRAASLLMKRSRLKRRGLRKWSKMW